MIAAQSTADGNDGLVASAMVGTLTTESEATVGMVSVSSQGCSIASFGIGIAAQCRPRNDNMNRTTTTRPTR